LTDKPPSEAFVALREYFEAHSRATLLLLTAARDYAAARCLLLNGFVAGPTRPPLWATQALKRT
jgi:hypothetical protein